MSKQAVFCIARTPRQADDIVEGLRSKGFSTDRRVSSEVREPT